MMPEKTDRIQKNAPQGALNGIMVIDLSRLLPGPYCSMILADHGARVIAVEDLRYETDGYFVDILYRNKEHMALNLKSAVGQNILYELVKKADVVLEGFRPGVAKRLGVDYHTLKEINPKIIYCAITGYGQNGPLSDVPGHDINYMAKSGLLDLIGQKDAPPSIPGVQFADVAGGGLSAALGILLALQSRHQTGMGQYVDISMTDQMLGFLTVPLYLYALTGTPPQRANSFLSHQYAFYNTYETKDGKYIAVGALEPQFWQNICHHLQVPQYIPLQFDLNHQAEIIDFFQSTFKLKTLTQWMAELDDVEACISPIQSMTDVISDPSFKERQMIVDFQDKSENRRPTIGVPIKMGQTPGTIRSTPAHFGEHTCHVLKEIGFSQEEIQNFIDQGITK